MSDHSGNRKKKMLIVTSIMIVFLLVALYIINEASRPIPPRVTREHTNAIVDDFKFLTKCIPASSKYRSSKLSYKEISQDLDQFEWFLENRFSYLFLTDVDYKQALDTIRASAKNGINRNSFCLQLNKVISLFSDSHAKARPSLMIFGDSHLPFILESLNGKFAAITKDRTAFVSENYPYLKEINGVAVGQWLKKARLTIPNGSTQFVNCTACRTLMNVDYLRKEFNLPAIKTLEVVLEAANGKETTTLTLKPDTKKQEYIPYPAKSHQILEGNIGYLRVNVMDFKEEVLQEALSSMTSFKKTSGLIIDVRGNRGGSRDLLRTLLPFFINPQEPPQVVNLAKYRLGHAKDVLNARWLYPVDHHWTPEELNSINNTIKDLEPQPAPPADKFSDWHFMVISAKDQPPYYHYDRPVVILSDGWCHSATDIFLGAFKGRNNITLIGTPSGGGSGRTKKFGLKNSHIPIRLSSMASYLPDGTLYEGIGVKPDIYMEKTLTDMIGKTDSYIDRATEIIQDSARSVAAKD